MLLFLPCKLCIFTAHGVVDYDLCKFGECLENLREAGDQWVKPTETFQYTHFTSCHPPGVKIGFVKGEALRILRTNSSKATFEENISKFKKRLLARGYPNNLIKKILSETKFTGRVSALKQDKQTQKEILPFVTQYQPSVPNIKQALIKKWHLIQNQPLLRQIFKEPPIISFKKGKSLKDTLIRAKI